MSVKVIIGNKHGSGSIYLGFMIMIIAFVAILVCINLFQLYTLNTQVQIISDAIADGSASAGLNMFSFDETRMRTAAERIFQENNKLLDNAFLSYTIQTTNEKDKDGNITNNKLITVEVYGRTEAFNSGLISSFTRNNADSSYSAKARSVVRAEVKIIQNTWITETLLSKGEYYELPFATTEYGKRNPNYTNWLIDYYLCPGYNPIYKKSEHSTITKANHLLYDYCKGMGIPGLVYGDFKNDLSIILSDLKTNQYSGFGTWTKFTSASTLQSNADAGRPTVIICETKLGQPEAYIVVPQKNALTTNQFAVAYANNTCSNYEIKDWEEFHASHQFVFAIGDIEDKA